MKDLVAARLAAGGCLEFEVSDLSVHDLDGHAPVVRYRKGGEEIQLACDFIAGCDGFRGVCRPSIPECALTIYERDCPFAWLGILAEAAPASPELVYSFHERGFALFSMRSVRITRLYLQCAIDEELKLWTNDRIWEELHTRLSDRDGWAPHQGPILQKGLTGLRSFVAEPMRYGRLFLAGNAAHVVPPTGAKGMNLAVADVRVLSEALAAFYRTGSSGLLDAYSATCLRRVWKAQRFSWWMTAMLHRFDTERGFEYRRQLAELDYVTTSRAAMLIVSGKLRWVAFLVVS